MEIFLNSDFNPHAQIFAWATGAEAKGSRLFTHPSCTNALQAVGRELVTVYFHLNSTPLGVGSIVEPGNWGRIIRLYGLSHGRFAIEAAMEDVRANEFAHLPSRLEAAFFFDDVHEAKHYADADNSRRLMLLYQVELVDNRATLHRTDWRNNVPDGHLSLDWIRRYWLGEMLPPINGRECRELLATTPLRIVGAVPR
ncbi:hypothetical protein [Devosia geojensis]|uniref:hypothetical protein n=1 Tax=Devosia geojensis TaxID=443610 RepID=UPI000696D0DD|nr:hypothetical protein [Devosia geojensis]